MALGESLKEELAVSLYDIGVIKFSDFEWTLKSGRKSPVYYNQRGIGSWSGSSNRERSLQARDLLIEGISEAIDDMVDEEGGYDHLYGLPQSATQLTGMIAERRNDSVLWGRVGKKDYGAHAQLEGNYGEGQSVVAIDDVITNADSKLEAAESMDAAGLDVNGFVVVMDRQEGGQETLKAAGYTLVSVLNMAETVRMLRENDRIGNVEFEWMAQYGRTLIQDGIVERYPVTA
ncbi:TPA: hypothetical protein EYO12_04260 [Candidatus Saccharibacteria bacterium]|nr:hypothetical protein [Candidatus Saccharibacteria bacterium]HIO87751.1 hypothetical protein [Candidatus Saccharibacteria bacterium]